MVFGLDGTAVSDDRSERSALSPRAASNCYDWPWRILASELTRNTLIPGAGGMVSWELLCVGAKRGVRLRFEAAAPGIPDRYGAAPRLARSLHVSGITSAGSRTINSLPDPGPSLRASIVPP